LFVPALTRPRARIALCDVDTSASWESFERRSRMLYTCEYKRCVESTRECVESTRDALRVQESTERR
jgi:hypothetical protein